MFTQDTFAFQSLIAFKCLFQVHHLPTVTDREFKSAKLLCSYEPFDLFILFGIKRGHIYMYECLYMLFNVWMQCIGIYADIFNVAELIYYCSVLPFSTINENKSFGHFWFIRQTSNLNFCVKFNSGISSFFNLKRKIEMCRQTNTDIIRMNK